MYEVLSVVSPQNTYIHRFLYISQLNTIRPHKFYYILYTYNFCSNNLEFLLRSYRYSLKSNSFHLIWTCNMTSQVRCRLVRLQVLGCMVFIRHSIIFTCRQTGGKHKLSYCSDWLSIASSTVAEYLHILFGYHFLQPGLYVRTGLP